MKSQGQQTVSKQVLFDALHVNRGQFRKETLFGYASLHTVPKILLVVASAFRSLFLLALVLQVPLSQILDDLVLPDDSYEGSPHGQVNNFFGFGEHRL